MITRLRRAGRLVHYRLSRLRRSRVTIIRPDGAAAGGNEIGLAIATYNRPDYLRRMLEHLGRSGLQDTIVALVDDASSSGETTRLVRDVSLGPTPIVRIFRTRRRGYGVDEALRDAWDVLANEYGCRLLANVDSDTVMKPEWLERLVDVFHRERARQGPLIVTGFNARQHDVIAEAGDFCLKASIGGLNMLFDAGLYHEVIRPNLRYEPMGEVGWDWHVVARMRERGYPLLCVRPSVVQHIGAVGRFSHAGGYDVADDY